MILNKLNQFYWMVYYLEKLNTHLQIIKISRIPIVDFDRLANKGLFWMNTVQESCQTNTLMERSLFK